MLKIRSRPLYLGSGELALCWQWYIGAGTPVFSISITRAWAGSNGPLLKYYVSHYAGRGGNHLDGFLGCRPLCLPLLCKTNLSRLQIYTHNAQGRDQRLEVIFL